MPGSGGRSQFGSANALKLLDLVTYPCSVLISGLVVAIAAVLLWRRLGPFAALAPRGRLGGGNAIEVFLKGTLVRPAVYGTDGRTASMSSPSTTRSRAGT